MRKPLPSRPRRFRQLASFSLGSQAAPLFSCSVRPFFVASSSPCSSLLVDDASPFPNLSANLLLRCLAYHFARSGQNRRFRETSPFFMTYAACDSFTIAESSSKYSIASVGTLMVRPSILTVVHTIVFLTIFTGIKNVVLENRPLALTLRYSLMFPPFDFVCPHPQWVLRGLSLP